MLAGGIHVQRPRVTWVGPVREPVMRDESGEGGGDCQTGKGLSNVGGGLWTLRQWDPLNCLCAGGWGGDGISSNYPS